MIDDCRNYKDFKIVTFSGYKKNDVINAFLKGIDSKNIETACNWLIECILDIQKKYGINYLFIILKIFI